MWKDPKNKQLFITCDCHSLDHMIVFDKHFLDDEDSIIFSVRLKDLPFFQRLKVALNYIFGRKYSNNDYDFVEFILNRDSCKRISEFLNINKSETEEFELENGKTYIDGHGDKWLITSISNRIEKDYPVTGMNLQSKDYCTYTKKGIYSTVNTESKRNLIKEVL